MKNIIGLDFCFPHQFLPAILMASLLSVGVLISLFAYLDHYTQRRYFRTWTAAWLFYALWLVLSLRELEWPNVPVWLMLKHWCLSAAAVSLLWGSVQFLRLRSRPELFALFLLFLLTWSYAGAYELVDPVLQQAPIFILIGLASLLASVCFYTLRTHCDFLGAGLLAHGFALWGIYMAGFPFLQRSEYLHNAGLLIAAVLQVFIAVSMIVLVLEETRATEEAARQEALRQKTRNQALQVQADSSEERYRTLVENSLDGIFIVDAAGKLLLANQGAANIFEFEPAQMPGCVVLDLLVQDVRETFRDDLLKLGQGAAIGPRNYLGITRQGRTICIETLSRRLKWESQWAVLMAFRDITGRQHMEERLRQVQTIEAITQLAGGIAHDFNNILTVVLGHVRLLLDRPAQPQEVVTSLKQIGSSAERAANLTHQLLTYSRRQVVRREALNLNSVINQVQGRLQKMAAAHTTFELHLDSKLPTIHADAWMVETILMNLAKNAIEAMPQGGQLRIVTESVQVDDAAAQADSDAIVGPAVCLRVQDTGCGMDDSVQKRLFEPFFTTKELATGTGLGLPMVYGIVKQHEGWIIVQSQKGQGTTVSIYFPLGG